jgi:demethylmenaquinone methyltransferase/2-methoxy-6-polyprenyl-1,4-benzoquinol methylase
MKVKSDTPNPRRGRERAPFGDQLIDEQIRYYRARAAEYDATSVPPDDPFAADADRIRHALRAFAPRGRVIELAAGTGQWTGLLAEYASELTAVDASPEMLGNNAARHGDRGVKYVLSDVFALRPAPTWDVVFFGFWLSHVPSGRFREFWDLVAKHLQPEGRVFFIDEADHGLWEEDWIDRASGIVRRRLNDGSEYRAVKVLWGERELERRLASLGWSASVHASGPFYWGTASRTQTRSRHKSIG